MSDITWVKTARKIKEKHQAQKIDPITGKRVALGKRGGILLDALTASLLIQIYDNLNEQNQLKFSGLPILKAVNIAWKLTK